MSSREERNDLELERLFKSMDEVRASDELKASTLAAIFEQLDEGPVDAEEREAARTAVRPALALVTDDGASDASDARVEEPTASVATGARAEEPTASVATGEDKDEAGAAKKAVRPRRRRFGLKVAAAVLVVAIGLGGVLSYAIPASHVTVSAGDTTFDLGVNVYGTTVSATANSDDGRAAISSAEVHNVGFQDALGRLIDAYDQQRGGEQDEVQVSVHDPFGGGERFASEADRVLEGRRPASPGSAEAPAQGEGAGPGSAGEPESFSPPAQDAGGDGGVGGAVGGGGSVGGGPGFVEGGSPAAEGGLGGEQELSGGGEVAAGRDGQGPSGGSAPGDGGMEGSLGGANEQSGMSAQGSAPQSGQGQGQGPGGAPR